MWSVAWRLPELQFARVPPTVYRWHTAFLSGCAPSAFCPPRLTRKPAEQWMTGARACPPGWACTPRLWGPLLPQGPSIYVYYEEAWQEPRWWRGCVLAGKDLWNMQQFRKREVTGWQEAGMHLTSNYCTRHITTPCGLGRNTPHTHIHTQESEWGRPLSPSKYLHVCVVFEENFWTWLVQNSFVFWRLGRFFCSGVWRALILRLSWFVSRRVE